MNLTYTKYIFIRKRHFYMAGVAGQIKNVDSNNFRFREMMDVDDGDCGVIKWTPSFVSLNYTVTILLQLMSM